MFFQAKVKGKIKELDYIAVSFYFMAMDEIGRRIENNIKKDTLHQELEHIALMTYKHRLAQYKISSENEKHKLDEKLLKLAELWKDYCSSINWIQGCIMKVDHSFNWKGFNEDVRPEVLEIKLEMAKAQQTIKVVESELDTILGRIKPILMS